MPWLLLLVLLLGARGLTASKGDGSFTTGQGIAWKFIGYNPQLSFLGMKIRGIGLSNYTEEQAMGAGHLYVKFRERAAKWYGGDETDWWLYKKDEKGNKFLILNGTDGEVSHAVASFQRYFDQLMQSGKIVGDFNGRTGTYTFAPIKFYPFTAEEPYEIEFDASSWIENRQAVAEIIKSSILRHYGLA